MLWESNKESWPCLPRLTLESISPEHKDHTEPWERWSQVLGEVDSSTSDPLQGWEGGVLGLNQGVVHTHHICAGEMPEGITSLHPLDLGIRLVRDSLDVPLNDGVLLRSVGVGVGVLNELRVKVLKHLSCHKFTSSIKVDVPDVVVVLEHEGLELLEGIDLGLGCLVPRAEHEPEP